LGCGDGVSFLLAREKKAKIRGIELNDSAIYEWVKNGHAFPAIKTFEIILLILYIEIIDF
jgi:hypothetical protein